jgi:spermidine/putrescine transport system permease protein
MSPAEQTQITRSARNGWLLSGPALALLIFAAAGPLLIVVAYSFLTPGTYGNVARPYQFSWEGWIGVIYSRDMFDETLVWADANLTIFVRTLKLASLTTVMTLVAGLPTAWFIATRSPKARAFWLFLITIPFWTNLLVRTFAIGEIVRNGGLLNTVLIGLGLTDQPIQIMYTDTAVFVGMVYVYIPLMVLPLFAAIDRFDMRLLEAAYDLYASRWQVLRRIILPLISPGIVAGSILVFIPALSAYVTPRILGGGKNMMISNFIELQFGQGRNWPLGASLSVSLLIIVTIALYFYVRVTTKENAHG